MSEPTTVFRVGESDRGKRLDRFLGERIPGLSRSRIQQAIRSRIGLSWAASVRPSTPVRPGGEVRIGWTPLPETPLDLRIPILTRGSGWIAVDKPPGVPVHPVNRVRENSLIRLLRRQEGIESLRLVHRLDRETTGVLLVAEDAATAARLSTAFGRGGVSKEYVALVHGEPERDEGEIDLPIGEAAGSLVWVKRAARAGGQPAFTAWRVERRLPGAALLRLHPRTGRRHQLRVHLSAIGHPIVGDLLYGRPEADYLALVRSGKDARRDEGGAARQMLHGARVSIEPIGADPGLDVSAPFPADLLAAMAAFR